MSLWALLNATLCFGDTLHAARVCQRLLDILVRIVSPELQRWTIILFTRIVRLESCETGEMFQTNDILPTYRRSTKIEKLQCK